MIKVLVIEDDEIDRLAYQRRLSSDEFEIIERSYGRGAIEISKKIKPDCIIVDYHLPDIKAEDLICSFQADEVTKNIPIIVLTGQGNEEAAVNTLKLGAKDYINKSNLTSINLGDIIKQAIHDLQFDSKLQKDYEEIKFIASHDYLTGLANRANFEQHIQRVIEDSVKSLKQCSVFFIDLNKFKPINDDYGHEFGDAILIEVGKRLQACLRTDDKVSRLGGDEFGVLLVDIKEYAVIGRKAQEIINLLSEPYQVLGKELCISASIGIACYPHSAKNVKSLLKCADIAMYKAKSAEGSAYRFYEKSLSQEISKLNTIKSDLQRSLVNNELAATFQPVRQSHDKGLVGFKMYINWLHAGYTNLTSSIINHYADQVGLMYELLEWTLQSALYQLGDFLKVNQEFQMYIPITTGLLSNDSFVSMAESLMNRYHLQLPQLHFILNENDLSSRNKTQLIEVMRRLDKKGIKFGLNEIVLNQLSLVDLSELPVQALYIDKSTVANLNHHELSQQMADCVTHLSRIFHFKLIADGVRNNEELNFLNELSQDFLYIERQHGLVQGFLTKDGKIAQN